MAAIYSLINACVVEREKEDVCRAARLQVVHDAARVFLEDERLHRHPVLGVQLRDRRRSLTRRHLRVFFFRKGEGGISMKEN